LISWACKCVRRNKRRERRGEERRGEKEILFVICFVSNKNPNEILKQSHKCAFLFSRTKLNCVHFFLSIFSSELWLLKLYKYTRYFFRVHTIKVASCKLREREFSLSRDISIQNFHFLSQSICVYQIVWFELPASSVLFIKRRKNKLYYIKKIFFN
jgi:hypothetical protein